jgi:hypothetical protein
MFGLPFNVSIRTGEEFKKKRILGLKKFKNISVKTE